VFSDLACALKTTRHDRDEFFAAEASDDVVGVRPRPHHPAEQTQDFIACVVWSKRSLIDLK
jgi:hypothetical protein